MIDQIDHSPGGGGLQWECGDLKLNCNSVAPLSKSLLGFEGLQ